MFAYASVGRLILSALQTAVSHTNTFPFTEPRRLRDGDGDAGDGDAGVWGDDEHGMVESQVGRARQERATDE